jgi:hypothetical protein
MKKSLLTLFVILIFIIAAYSKSKVDVLEILKAGKTDANIYTRAYLYPYAMALGDGLNNGWYNSAITHKLFGFDFNMSVSAIQIPKSQTTMDLNELGLTLISPENSSAHIAPTIAGPNEEGPSIIVKDDSGNIISSFNSPKGTGESLVPVPMVQISFGILPHTDFIGRFVPKLKFDNNSDNEQPTKVGLWGIGFKHNFKEWIPYLKSLPFDASVFGGYTQIDAQSGINLDEYGDGDTRIVSDDSSSQLLKFKTKTMKLSLIISKKISVLTFFGGIGQSKSETTVNFLGNYLVETSTGTIIYALKDPIDLNFKTTNFSMDAGVRLKLAFFSLFGSVNKAKYVSYNAGVSFGFR